MMFEVTNLFSHDKDNGTVWMQLTEGHDLDLRRVNFKQDCFVSTNYS